MKVENDYNKFLTHIGITHKTNIKRCEFDHKVWDKLAEDIKLDRMLKFTSDLLVMEDDWAEKKMLERRLKREYIYPRGKTKKIW